MNRKSLRRVLGFPHPHYSGTLIPILLFFVIGSSIIQASSQSLAITQVAKLEAVKFAVPQGFELERSGTHRVSFMRNSSEPIGLFVTVLERPLDDKYLTNLSNDLLSLLRRGDEGFRWKIQETLKPRISRYQTNRGTIKGLKGNTFVQVDFVVVRSQDKDVVIGSIAQFGEEQNSSFLFEVEGREHSVRGWEALFQLISSVTGEKDNELR